MSDESNDMDFKEYGKQLQVLGIMIQDEKTTMKELATQAAKVSLVLRFSVIPEPQQEKE